MSLYSRVPSALLAALVASSILAASDAGASSPHLDAVEEVLRRLTPDSEGKSWERTSGNQISGGWGSWLLQTPDCWRDEECAIPLGAYQLADAIHDTVAAATELVDVTTLATYPDGMYEDAFVSGLRVALENNPTLKIRVLAGTPPSIVMSKGLGQKSAGKYWEQLQSELGDLADDARIMIGGVTTKWAYSWNHSKIIAVDGDTAIVGGHNLWSGVYGEVAEPVSDVSMQLRGPAAISSHKFANELWAFACENQDHAMNVALHGSAALTGDCLDSEAPWENNEIASRAETDGDVDVLSVGGLGLGMRTPGGTEGALEPAGDSHASYTRWFSDYPNNGAEYSVANPDTEALRALIASATDNVFLSQQDLIAPVVPPFANAIYDARLFDVLADKLIEGVPVRMVLSTPGAKPYSEIESFDAVTRVLVRKVSERAPATTTLAEAIVCSNLQLAPIRIADGAAAWGSGRGIANHAKIVVVDDAAFYIGSRNLYPTNLQEFGFIVEDDDAMDTFNAEYTDPMWNNSSWAAVVDYQTGVCKV